MPAKSTSKPKTTRNKPKTPTKPKAKKPATKTTTPKAKVTNAKVQVKAAKPKKPKAPTAKPKTPTKPKVGEVKPPEVQASPPAPQPPETHGRGWCLVMQPNGKFARYSEAARAFTHINMNREAAETTCRREGLTFAAAAAEINRAAGDPEQWKQTSDWIRKQYAGSMAQTEQMIAKNQRKR